ncbi:N-terminal acetyltransferase B complex catalytic subunit [Lachnellula hyalina]|uniref:N-terminal acetyltransferase B complex catalytic subunit n=2 Tax=Lachnellula TaxID=47830 RepID=A0A8H8QUN3_9HELO|nr:N-terminal acetyltransferase B complex catalytic subunit [Lachnellula hyalina]TVY22831.1 N-terminal acetyltransferase B complex catalytic subunit [Lachnellula hyalina]
MTSLRPFHATDVFKFNPTNLDPLTETYDLNFYFSYIARWPHLFNVAEGRDGTIDAYIMGKLESSPPYQQFSPHYLPYHAHITALTVSPFARRLGLARTLSSSLERSGDSYDAWFVDLFVRKSNRIAQRLYEGMGYSVYRRVVDYYSDDLADPGKSGEDAYDMRKPLRRDGKREHVRERGEEFEVAPEDVW